MLVNLYCLFISDVDLYYVDYYDSECLISVYSCFYSRMDIYKVI